MEKALDSSQTRSLTVVTVTPDQLRLIADRLEDQARKGHGAGREIFYSFTRNIELMFDPRDVSNPHHHTGSTGN